MQAICIRKCPSSNFSQEVGYSELLHDLPHSIYVEQNTISTLHVSCLSIIL
jgi:hypothetical protein